MTIAARQTRVFVTLLLSMSIGIAVLKVLGTKPSSADAFCLYDYYQLEPVEKLILPEGSRPLNRWERIEIFLSAAEPENEKQKQIANSKMDNCHFIVCNGITGSNGQIVPAEKWQSQQPVLSVRSQNHNTIYICVVTNSQLSVPSDLQITRTEDLAMQLARRFDVRFRRSTTNSGYI